MIIKPVLDATSSMAISQISFLSGCTALAMAFVSLSKKKGEPGLFDKEVAVKLAVGAVVGGSLGNILFNYVKEVAQNDIVIGIIQNFLMIILTVGVIVYMYNKKKITTIRVTNVILCLTIGLGLGLVSSFLGIGGGPINLVVLYYFFSMSTKASAYNSIFIILFSQISSVVMAFATQSVPTIDILFLVVMVLGGIFGGVIGKKIAKKITGEQIEKLFFAVLILISVISVYNMFKYFFALG